MASKIEDLIPVNSVTKIKQINCKININIVSGLITVYGLSSLFYSSL